MESNKDVFNPKMFISDKYLLENQIVSRKTTFLTVDINKMFNTPIKVADISQNKIGNCYMLAALASIIERSPFYLNNIMNSIEIDGKQYVEVMLHDSNNIDKKITYVLDPTIIVDSEAMNQHSHDAIYLLEKAYAIHRIINEKKLFEENELEILNVLKDVDFDCEAAYEALVGNIEKKLIIKVKEKYDNNYQTYTSALNSGSPCAVYSSILGVASDSVKIPFEYSAEYLLCDFISNMQMFKLTDIDLTSKKFSESIEKVVLEKMFDAIDTAEAKFFINMISPRMYMNGSNLFVKIQSSKSLPQEDIHILLNIFFSEEVEMALHNLDSQRVSHFEVAQNVKIRVNDFITKEIPYKRGLGIYIPSQIEMFNLINEKLKEGQLLALSTKKIVGRNQAENALFAGEPLSKGLAGGHGYHIINCYEKGKLKFILIRNPWGEYTRDYKLKDKIISRKKIQVLSASGRSSYTFSSLAVDLFNLNSKDPIIHPAIPVNDTDFFAYKKHGYFEIELGDLTKRFSYISITNAQGGVQLFPSKNLVRNK